jgi:hypothetical protein
MPKVDTLKHKELRQAKLQEVVGVLVISIQIEGSCKKNYGKSIVTI